MALELAKLINCDVANSDQENLDRLLEEYMCGGSDESGSESDTDECNGRSSDEDDLFDDWRNDLVAAESDDIVLDSVDEELAKVNRFRYVWLLSTYVVCAIGVCASYPT